MTKGIQHLCWWGRQKLPQIYISLPHHERTYKFFNGPIRNVNSRLPIHDGRPLKKLEEHFTTIVDLITSGEVSPFSNRDMLRKTAPLNRNELIFPITDLAKLYAVSVELLLPLIRSYGEEILVKDWKKGMIIEIQEKAPTLSTTSGSVFTETLV